MNPLFLEVIYPFYEGGSDDHPIVLNMNEVVSVTLVKANPAIREQHGEWVGEILTTQMTLYVSMATMTRIAVESGDKKLDTTDPFDVFLVWCNMFMD